MPIGRVTKLTPHLQTAIATAVAAGVPFATACLLAGIDASTAQQWLQRGQGRHKTRGSTPAYVAFVEAITRARAQDEARRIARIGAAAKGGAVLHEKIITYPDGRQTVERQLAPPDWRADAFHLERAYADRWGRRLQADVQLRIRQIAQEVADEIGIDVNELLREAESYLREHP